MNADIGAGRRRRDWLGVILAVLLPPCSFAPAFLSSVGFNIDAFLGIGVPGCLISSVIVWRTSTGWHWGTRAALAILVLTAPYTLLYVRYHLS